MPACPLQTTDAVQSSVFGWALLAIAVAMCWYLFKKGRSGDLYVFVFTAVLTFVIARLHRGRCMDNIALSIAGVFIIGFANFMWVRTVQFLYQQDGMFRSYLFPIAVSSLGLFVSYAYLFRTLGLRGQDGCVTHNIFSALYFTVSTWTTVGYGDLVPADGWSRFFAALAALNGYAVLAIAISALLPFFSKKVR